MTENVVVSRDTADGPVNETVAVEQGNVNLHQPEAAPAPEVEVRDPLDGLKPGRIVYYWPTTYQERDSLPGPWPSMVTRVISDSPIPGRITLNANLPERVPVGTDPVLRIQDVDFAGEPPARPEGKTDEEYALLVGDSRAGKWTWMFEGQAGRYKA